MREELSSVAQCAAGTHVVGLVILGLSTVHRHVAELLFAFAHCAICPGVLEWENWRERFGGGPPLGGL